MRTAQRAYKYRPATSGRRDHVGHTRRFRSSHWAPELNCVVDMQFSSVHPQPVSVCQRHVSF